MDIDLLGRTNNQESAIVDQITDILTVPVPADGLIFDPRSIQAERITEDADYEGLRIRFLAMLDSARVNMQIDIGFGDSVYPEPQNACLPTILDHPPPRLLCYSRESTIAEKLEIMIKLGPINSRMKDFHDIWFLCRRSAFEGPTLAEAIRLTFARRGTTLPPKIEAFSDAFIDTKQPQWAAFKNRLSPNSAPASFRETVTAIADFLDPVVSAITNETTPPGIWRPGGPWG